MTERREREQNGKGKEKIPSYHEMSQMALCAVPAIGSLRLVLTGPHTDLQKWPWHWKAALVGSTHPETMNFASNLASWKLGINFILLFCTTFL